jgi:hypothetical protein
MIGRQTPLESCDWPDESCATLWLVDKLRWSPVIGQMSPVQPYDWSTNYAGVLCYSMTDRLWRDVCGCMPLTSRTLRGRPQPTRPNGLILIIIIIIIIIGHQNTLESCDWPNKSCATLCLVDILRVLPAPQWRVYVKTFAVGVNTACTPEEGAYSPRWLNGLVIIIIYDWSTNAAVVLWLARRVLCSPVICRMGAVLCCAVIGWTSMCSPLIGQMGAVISCDFSPKIGHKLFRGNVECGRFLPARLYAHTRVIHI